MASNGKKGLKVEKLMGIVFGSIGLVMLTIGIVIAIVQISFINSAEEVYATITDISGGERSGTEFTYTYDGEEYEEWLSVYSSTFHRGDKVKVYVDKENPRRVEPASFLFFPVYITGGIGAVFFAFGFMFFMIAKSQNKKKKRLMAEGRKLYAEVTGGSMNFNYRVNGRHPFKLECQYTDTYTGAVYLFSSDNTWVDPNLYIGKQVVVYADSTDFSKYYVDMDSLNEVGIGNENAANVYDFR